MTDALRWLRCRWITVGSASLILICIILGQLPDPLFPMASGQLVLDRNDRIIRAYLNPDDHFLYPDMKSAIPEKLKTAILLFEDRDFNDHMGIDFGAILRALWQNVSEGRIVSGASTIPMQVARRTNPTADRNLWNKFREMCQAVHLELRYSKADILKFYCNYAPYGKNIIGYVAASHRYFGKPPMDLTWAEASLLAVLPNAPGLINPGRNTHLLKRKRDRLLQDLHRHGFMSADDLKLAQLEAIPRSIIPFSMPAPHFTRFVQSRHDDSILRTTLDSRIQTDLNTVMTQSQIQLRQQGIHNLSAIVIHTRTREVLAYSGSADFWDRRHSGMVDGVQAGRSSGSTLKPILYALAIQDGMIMPHTLVRDIPSYYDGFAPHNADEKYSGAVRVREALTRSLNVPPVRILYQYGTHRFYQSLQQMGITTLFRSSKDYGLPIILGGAETSLWDLTKLYTGLGNQGQFADHVYLRSDSARAEKKLEAMAAWMVLDMLRDVKRPGIEYYWSRFDSQRPMAWKTGTSYGHKDAWAIGVTPEYTIGVWAGNFDGTGVRDLSGAASAGPVLFDIFDKLPHNGIQQWFDRPEFNGTPISLCKQTGFQAGDWCFETENALAPPTRHPLPRCNWHQQVFLSPDETRQVCSQCWQGGYQTQTKLVYPPEIARQFNRNGRSVFRLPMHRRSCPAFAEQTMHFTYPESGSVIQLPLEMDGRHMKMIAKVAHRSKSIRLFWYLNDHYLGETTRPELAITCPSGDYLLTVIDANGSQISNRFTVKRRESR